MTIVAVLVAVYGAVLSTYSLILRRREKARRVAVSLSMGFVGSGGQRVPMMVLLQAANPGDRAVTLQVPTLRLPSGDSLFPPVTNSDVRFPCELQEGKSCTCWFEAQEVALRVARHGHTGKVKFVGIVRDAVGGSYTSKPLRFNVDRWLQDSEESITS